MTSDFRSHHLGFHTERRFAAERLNRAIEKGYLAPIWPEFGTRYEEITQEEITLRAEDARGLHGVQERSYEKAGAGIRGSFPRSRAMDAGRLGAFLDHKRYAVFATSRPDGRAHAAPVAFVVWQGGFWVASVEGARTRNLRARPYASIVVMEGEGDSHKAVIAEGPVHLHEARNGTVPEPGFLEAYNRKHGGSPTWARVFIELRPERLFSYDATKGSGAGD